MFNAVADGMAQNRIEHLIAASLRRYTETEKKLIIFIPYYYLSIA